MSSILPGNVAGMAFACGYALLAALSLQVWARLHKARRPQARDWIGLAVLFLLLAVARAGAAEEQVHAFARAAFKSEGLYEDRRGLQMLIISLTSFIALGASMRLSRRRTGMHPSPILGLSIVAVLLLSGIRTISWHDTDAILFMPLGPLRLHHLMEAGLMAILATRVAPAAIRSREHK